MKRPSRIQIALIALAVTLPAAPALSYTISLQQVLTGLSSPVNITHAGDGSGRMFIVEQAGRVLIYKNGSLLGTPFLDIRSKVSSGGERGLLSVAFHPQFESNRRFFVYYTSRPNGDIAISEFAASTGNPDIADTTERVMMTVSHSTYSNHNGGQVQFGPDGYLYIGTGDGGGGGDPLGSGQNINTLLGKILRIDVNGVLPYAIPTTNPYVGTAGLDEIYAIGMRNPWRFSFDRVTGALWAGDVGQGSREEIDLIVAGANYGWNTMEGSLCYSPPSGCNTSGLTLPVTEYSHSGGNCSVTGGYVYRGALSGEMYGSYLYGDYCTGIIWSYSGGVSSQLLDTSLSIASFGEDESGELYVVSLGGSVQRIIGPTGGSCSLTCPADIEVTDSDGNGVEIVAYDPPAWSGTCGTVTSTPASGSAFPVGATTVTATSSIGGGACSFTVTVIARDLPIEVTSCKPRSGKRGQELEIEVFGSGFDTEATASLGGGIKVLDTHWHSAGEVHVEIKIGKRARKATRNLTVSNPDGRSAVCEDCFRVK